jgi:glyoxylase-like metal-dependent hydrolase (beta-lactamase superfamily II)
MDLGRLDAMVISQLHLDHVGGPAAMRRRTCTVAAEPLKRAAAGPRTHRRAHPRAEVIPTVGAQGERRSSSSQV